MQKHENSGELINIRTVESYIAISSLECISPDTVLEVSEKDWAGHLH
jgi:hypothetical protein